MAPGRRSVARSGAVASRPARSRGAKDPVGVAAGAPLNRAEELLLAAFELFAERNFASVTIKDIGAATGANTALIYYYFGSKEELFRATIENAVDRAFHQFRLLRGQRTTPPEVIAGWLENHVTLQDLIRKLVKIGLDYAGTARRTAAIDRSIRRFYDDEAAAVGEAIREGIRQGLFRKVDPACLATFISTHLDGVMVRSVLFADFDVARAVAELQAQVWERLGWIPVRAR